MNVGSLALPAAAGDVIADEVARYGLETVETGGFLMARRGDDTVTTVALAGSAGVRRGWGRFQISELALDRLFEFAGERHLWIPAQFHSHRSEAFMSIVDVEHGLSVEDFISTVIPYYASPPRTPETWGWWRFAGDWIPVGPPTTVSGGVDVVRFDERGVKDG